jgi:hypothetical protein
MIRITNIKEIDNLIYSYIDNDLEEYINYNRSISYYIKNIYDLLLEYEIKRKKVMEKSFFLVFVEKTIRKFIVDYKNYINKKYNHFDNDTFKKVLGIYDFRSNRNIKIKGLNKSELYRKLIIEFYLLISLLENPPNCIKPKKCNMFIKKINRITPKIFSHIENDMIENGIEMN